MTHRFDLQLTGRGPDQLASSAPSHRETAQAQFLHESEALLRSLTTVLDRFASHLSRAET